MPLVALAFDLAAQYSSDPLPAFEEFAGGNYGIGRGFDPGAVLGDSGIGATFELRYGSLLPKGPAGFAVQPYVFSDVAQVWNEDPSLAGAFDDDQLWSLGGGLRFARGRNMQGDVAVAVPVQRTNTQTQLGDVRLLFSLTTRLVPWSF